MLDSSSSHLPNCAVSPVEFNRMEGLVSGMRATCESHFQSDVQLTAGNCHSSGLGTPVRRVMSLGSLPTKALPGWGVGGCL